MGYEDDGEEYFALETTCGAHGPDYIRECPSCKEEFCVRCFHFNLCPDCMEDVWENGPQDSDFSDVENIDRLLPDDPEVERVIDLADHVGLFDLNDRETDSQEKAG